MADVEILVQLANVESLEALQFLLAAISLSRYTSCRIPSQSQLHSTKLVPSCISS